ncbi:hypothetical protein [Marinilabilia salmonicolor]|uniref:hypothetical protein n=1 Tax=Marinilabilia salmonicolor TaxID=989 RepID=UPI0011E03955|nr:hypothetical protein [Marinilabilia salmonicolor]
MILSLNAFSALGQEKLKIIGLYGKCQSGYFACEQLEIKSDSTFEYGIFYDVGGWKIWTGSWVLSNDTLILNTFKQPQTESDSITISLANGYFYYTDFLTDLNMRWNGKKIYTWDSQNKEISRKRFLRKTNIKNKKFTIDKKY